MSFLLPSSQDGRTPLIFAAECGYLPAVKALIDGGADLLEMDAVSLFYCREWSLRRMNRAHVATAGDAC